MSKQHYAHVDLGNESNPDDDWGTTYCGLEYTESPLTNRVEFVDCKKCLKAIKKENKNKVVRYYNL